MAKAATKASTAKKATTTRATTRTASTRQVQKRGDQAPEAKATVKEQSAAAEKMFKDADTAAILGFPADMTVEQRENQVRRSALGY